MILYKEDGNVNVYGPFDTADSAQLWTHNFSGRKVSIDALIKPTHNAD